MRYLQRRSFFFYEIKSSLNIITMFLKIQIPKAICYQYYFNFYKTQIICNQVLPSDAAAYLLEARVCQSHLNLCDHYIGLMIK